MEWDKIANNWARMTLRLRNDGQKGEPSLGARPMQAVPNGSGASTRPHSAPGIRLPSTTSVKTTGNGHDLTPHR